jgi:hypothetical protein
MTKALSIETLLNEFDENTEVWMLADTSKFPYKYPRVPQNDGRQFYRFFLRKSDAQDLLIIDR